LEAQVSRQGYVEYRVPNKEEIINMLSTILSNMRVETYLDCFKQDYYDDDDDYYDDGHDDTEVDTCIETVEIRGFYGDIPVAVRCEEYTGTCQAFACVWGYEWATRQVSLPEPSKVIEAVRRAVEDFKMLYVKDVELCKDIDSCDCDLDLDEE
jgi:hypothetical protein